MIDLNFKIIFFAVMGGLIPAILWLWFWLKEEDFEEKEPIGLIILSFILGALTVFLAIWLEGIVAEINLSRNDLLSCGDLFISSNVFGSKSIV